MKWNGHFEFVVLHKGVSKVYIKYNIYLNESSSNVDNVITSEKRPIMVITCGCLLQLLTVTSDY